MRLQALTVLVSLRANIRFNPGFDTCVCTVQCVRTWPHLRTPCVFVRTMYVGLVVVY